MGEHDVSDFETQVLQRSHEVPVVVDFWAEWCGPCRMLGPVIESLAAEADGRWELAKLDTEAHPEVAAQFGIRSIPAVKLFIDGAVADEFVGALPEPQILAWLERALPSPLRGRIAAALEAAAKGDEAGAIETLKSVVEEEPDEHAARVALARLLVWEEPAAALEALDPVGMGSELATEAERIRELGHLFLVLDEPDELPQAPVRTSYLAAIAALRGRDFATALDGFITVIRQDRGYDDDGARKACLSVFEFLGEDDPVSRQYRPVFASAVYA